MKIVDPIAKLIGDWSMDIGNIWTILIRVFSAVICAGIIGVERAKKKHAAGFRTYMLVCLGATIIMMTNEFLFVTYNAGDTARLAAQVVSGIGFLGAGSILVTSRNQVKGLTTAAGLWASACMGIAIGAGYYTLALISELVIILILAFMPMVETYLNKSITFLELYVELDSRQNLKDLVNYFHSINAKINSIEKDPAYIQSGLSVYSIMLTTDKRRNKHDFIENIKTLSYVNYCEEVEK